VSRASLLAIRLRNHCCVLFSNVHGVSTNCQKMQPTRAIGLAPHHCLRAEDDAIAWPGMPARIKSRPSIADLLFLEGPVLRTRIACYTSCFPLYCARSQEWLQSSHAQHKNKPAAGFQFGLTKEPVESLRIAPHFLPDGANAIHKTSPLDIAKGHLPSLAKLHGGDGAIGVVCDLADPIEQMPNRFIARYDPRGAGANPARLRPCAGRSVVQSLWRRERGDHRPKRSRTASIRFRRERAVHSLRILPRSKRMRRRSSLATNRSQ